MLVTNSSKSSMCQYHAGKKNVNKYNPQTVTNRLEAAGLSKHNEPLTLILTLVTWTISLLLKNMLTLVFPSSVMYAASTKIHTCTGTIDKHTGTVAQGFSARLSLATISLILGLILAQCYPLSSSLAGKLDWLVPWWRQKACWNHLLLLTTHIRDALAAGHWRGEEAISGLDWA